ncbi:MAG: hypothetical protein ACYTEL_24745 [Planctomycetota bacterium]
MGGQLAFLREVWYHGVVDIVGRCEIDGKCQIVLAAIILGGVVAFAEFAPEARARGLAIEFGWDTPSIPWLCENAAITECTIPFDGIILDLAQLSWIAWAGDEIPSNVVQNAEEDISLLNDVNFVRLRENSFFRLNSSGWNTPPDWFDSDFNSVVSNTSFMADAVYQTDLAGIAFDPEDYFSSCWHYPSRKYSGTKTFAQYQAQVRQRGRQIAAAIKTVCPGRDFVMLFTFANSLPFLSTDWWGHPLSEDTYGLLPAFIDGLLDEACGQIRVIDGLESCYPHMTLAQFQGSVSNYQDGATLSADPSRYLSCVGIGFGTWMDYRSDALGWYTDPNEFHLNHFTPQTFNQAMNISTDLGEYSWVYTQVPDWYLGAVPKAYSDALSDVTGLPPTAPCSDLWARLAKAKNPLPVDGAENVHPHVVLSWQAGNKAASHDVYFGTDANAVGDANTSRTLGVYVGRQDACEYDPVIVLELGQRYYWRIDEVNDVNIWHGDVWCLTVDDGKPANPNPANGDRNVPRDMILNWSPGLVAGSHEVYFGTDFDTVSDANTSSPEHKGNQPLAHADYDPPGLLELAGTYYWRIDQVNPGYADSKGDVWSFTVSPCLTVDDMESYCTGTGCENKIYDTWIDYWTNFTGAIISLGVTPEPVHAASQSMLFDYDNNPMWGSYSETECAFDDPCDWATLRARVLTLYFYGDPNNDANITEQMYVGLQDSSGPGSYVEVRYGDNGEDMSDIRVAEWQQWNVALSDFAGVDLDDVNSIHIGFGDRVNPIAGGMGVVWFDDIEICAYRCILPAPYADLSGDCVVDHKDLGMLAEQWLATGSISADLYPDGKVDCKDFSVLAHEWLEDRLWP